MATRRTDARPTERGTTGDRPVTRYDLLLFAIPVPFVLAVLVAQVAPFGVTQLLAVASLVGALAVVDGLFVNPPSGPPRR